MMTQQWGVVLPLCDLLVGHGALVSRLRSAHRRSHLRCFVPPGRLPAPVPVLCTSELLFCLRHCFFLLSLSSFFWFSLSAFYSPPLSSQPPAPPPPAFLVLPQSLPSTFSLREPPLPTLPDPLRWCCWSTHTPPALGTQRPKETSSGREQWDKHSKVAPPPAACGHVQVLRCDRAALTHDPQASGSCGVWGMPVPTWGGAVA